MKLRGPLFVEFPELSAVKRSETEEVKRFVTIRRDNYRSPYGRVNEEWPRGCTFWGTTNDPDFLKDTTGNRRFWPVKCYGAIDLPGLRKIREKLWAEAVHHYRKGEPHWLDKHEDAELAIEVQEEHRLPDPWEEPIRRIVAGQSPDNLITTQWILSRLESAKDADFNARQMSKFDEMRVADCMKALGFKRTQKTQNRVRCWVRADGKDSSGNVVDLHPAGGKKGEPPRTTSGEGGGST